MRAYFWETAAHGKAVLLIFHCLTNVLTLKCPSFTKSALNPFPAESVTLGTTDSVTLGGGCFSSSSLTFCLKSLLYKPLFQLPKDGHSCDSCM